MATVFELQSAFDEATPQIKDYIRKNIVRDPTLTIEQDTSLIKSGLVDSLSLVELIALLEQLLHISIPVGKTRLEDFDTLSSMRAMVTRVASS